MFFSYLKKNLKMEPVGLEFKVHRLKVIEMQNYYHMTQV